MIEAVIFDMDGLLINTEHQWQLVERQIMNEVGVEITPEMQFTTLGLRSDEQLRYWYKLYPWKNPDLEAMDKKYTVNMVEYFKKDAVLMEGAIHALDFFREKCLPIALASSSTMELIDTFLDRFSLREYFTCVVSAENEPFGKPHPGVYLKTASQLHCEAIACLALEDSFHGLIAAKAAKMMCIAVPDERYTSDPRFGAADLTLSSLNDLTEESYQSIRKS